VILSDQTTGTVVFHGKRACRGRLCPVCGHDSWCLVDECRGLAICPRTEGKRKIGSAGWLHSTGGDVPAFKVSKDPEKAVPSLEGADLMQPRFVRQGAPRLGLLAMSLGLSLESLERLGTGWNGSAWTFPMRNDREEIVGFRTRFDNGSKFAIKGSRSGLFIPIGRTRGIGEVWIVEGPTDTAAMIEMGLNAIGRPSCMGSEQEIRRWTAGMDVLVVADNDGPGVKGAQELTRTLRGSARSVRMLLPPMGMKDAREVLNHGGSMKEWREQLTGSRSRRNLNGPQASN
jgi:hypothetical protein